jgi:hypothetical protein
MPAGGLAVADNGFVLVLNAGSSSLKFCVYLASAADSWRLEARGQIEGQRRGSPPATALAKRWTIDSSTPRFPMRAGRWKHWRRGFAPALRGGTFLASAIASYTEERRTPRPF